MESGKHTPADRLTIAQVSGLARHRDTDHRDRWPGLVAQMHAVTTDPHLLAHAAYRGAPAATDTLLELAGADMVEVARIRAVAVGPSRLAVLADRLGDQHVADKAKAGPGRPSGRI